MCGLSCECECARVHSTRARSIICRLTSEACEQRRRRQQTSASSSSAHSTTTTTTVSVVRRRDPRRTTAAVGWFARERRSRELVNWLSSEAAAAAAAALAALLVWHLQPRMLSGRTLLFQGSRYRRALADLVQTFFGRRCCRRRHFCFEAKYTERYKLLLLLINLI